MADAVIEALVYAAVFAPIIQSTVTDRLSSAARIEWASRIRNSLLICPIQAEDLARCDVEVLKNFDLTEQQPDRDLQATAWGRCLLGFDLEETECIWRRLDVRKFIHKVHTRNPAFPMYLHMNPGMACVWFGSLVALDAFHPDDDSGKFQITHPSLLPVIEECIDAIIELGNRRRWDIRLVVAQILGAFPTQLRHQIMQAFDLEPPVAQGQE